MFQFDSSYHTTPDKGGSHTKHNSGFEDADSFDLEDLDFSGRWPNDEEKTSNLNTISVNEDSSILQENSEHLVRASHSASSTSTNQLQSTSGKAVGRAQKLGGKKSPATKEEVSWMHNQTSLGDEYEIKHAKSRDLDFFADMEPEVSFTSFESRESIAASKYGSMLAVSEANSQVRVFLVIRFLTFGRAFLHTSVFKDAVYKRS